MLSPNEKISQLQARIQQNKDENEFCEMAIAAQQTDQSVINAEVQKAKDALAADMTAKDKTIEDLTKSNADKDVIIADLNTTIAAKDTELSTLKPADPIQT